MVAGPFVTRHAKSVLFLVDDFGRQKIPKGVLEESAESAILEMKLRRNRRAKGDQLVIKKWETYIQVREIALARYLLQVGIAQCLFQVEMHHALYRVR